MVSTCELGGHPRDHDIRLPFQRCVATFPSPRRGSEREWMVTGGPDSPAADRADERFAHQSTHSPDRGKSKEKQVPLFFLLEYMVQAKQ
ncbi:hypothetical protein VDGL01_07300 [Verticillium dahliae]